MLRVSVIMVWCLVSVVAGDKSAETNTRFLTPQQHANIQNIFPGASVGHQGGHSTQGTHGTNNNLGGHGSSRPIGGHGGNIGRPCRYFCRRPAGYECCDNLRQSTKPGQCPPRRAFCPGLRLTGPQYCENDYKCGGVDKCCPDVCVPSGNICKHPNNYGR